MKTIIRSLIIVFALLSAGKMVAQGTSLIIFSEKGEKFTLYVNGDQKNSSPAEHVRVDGLYGPTIKARVVFKDTQIPEISKTIFNKPGADIYYALRPGKKGAYTFEHATSDYIHKDEPVKEDAPAPPPSQSGTTKQDNPPDKKSSGSTKTSTGGCTGVMPEGDFQASVAMISNAPFEGQKTSQSKKLVEGHCLNCRQIVEVMYLVSYESSRLSIAKAAYIHCADPVNYESVKDALNTEKAKKELDQYISTVKQ
jgi:hypothetical protein